MFKKGDPLRMLISRGLPEMLTSFDIIRLLNPCDAKTNSFLSLTLFTF